MAKVTTVTTSYTSDIVVNGTAVSANNIYANGTKVRRCIVNGTDVIHKFTRTVVTLESNLTIFFTIRFTVDTEDDTYWGDTIYRFDSPIYLDVTVKDIGSSGFTSITFEVLRMIFYCYGGDSGENSSGRFYQQEITNRSFTLGQTHTLEFDYFAEQYIDSPDTNEDFAQYTGYELNFRTRDPDGVVLPSASSSYILEDTYSRGTSYTYTQTFARERVVNQKLSDSTQQEY